MGTIINFFVPFNLTGYKDSVYNCDNNQGYKESESSCTKPENQIYLGFDSCPAISFLSLSISVWTSHLQEI